MLPATRALTATLRGDDAYSPWWKWLIARNGDDEALGTKRMALGDVASRINAYAVLPPEVALLRRALPQLRGEPHEVPLFTAEDVFQKGPQEMEGPDVLLGNSATASNNHLDALDWLRSARRQRQADRAFVLWRRRIWPRGAALGRERFGERLDALTGWMALADYDNSIRRCGFVVMNHRRQQAVGDVTSALYKGATVYLRRENPLFDFSFGPGRLPARDRRQRRRARSVVDTEERSRNRQIVGAHYAGAARSVGRFVASSANRADPSFRLASAPRSRAPAACAASCCCRSPTSASGGLTTPWKIRMRAPAGIVGARKWFSGQARHAVVLVAAAPLGRPVGHLPWQMSEIRQVSLFVAEAPPAPASTWLRKWASTSACAPNSKRYTDELPVMRHGRFQSWMIRNSPGCSNKGVMSSTMTMSMLQEQRRALQAMQVGLEAW